MKKMISIIAILIATHATQLHAENSNENAQGGYSTKQSDDAELRLALTKVTLYTETNELDKAFKLIDELNAKYPDNRQVMLAAADLNIKADNRGSAYKYLNRAQTLDPLDEDVLERRRSVMQEDEPFVSIGETIKRSNQSNEQITTAASRIFLTPTVSASIIAENDTAESKDAVLRANGEALKFDDSKQRATFELSKLFENGNNADAFVHAGNSSVGGGAELSINDRYGKTALQGNFAKPEWDFIETLVGNGTKDNIRIARKQRLATNFEAILGGGFNRYNLEDDSDVARSKALDFSLAYTYPFQLSDTPGNDINLGLAYNLGGEYFFGRKEKVDSNGAAFRPFPAVSYEVHSLTASVSKTIVPNLTVDGFAGYAADRFGSNGPTFGAGATYAPHKNFSIELAGSRGIMGERRVGTVDQFNVNLKIHW